MAISLAPNREGIISEDAKLYDNRDINLEGPKIREIIGLDNTDFYIERIHHDNTIKLIKLKRKKRKLDKSHKTDILYSLLLCEKSIF